MNFSGYEQYKERVNGNSGYMHGNNFTSISAIRRVNQDVYEKTSKRRKRANNISALICLGVSALSAGLLIKNKGKLKDCHFKLPKLSFKLPELPFKLPKVSLKLPKIPFFSKLK